MFKDKRNTLYTVCASRLSNNNKTPTRWIYPSTSSSQLKYAVAFHRRLFAVFWWSYIIFVNICYGIYSSGYRHPLRAMFFCVLSKMIKLQLILILFLFSYFKPTKKFNPSILIGRGCIQEKSITIFCRMEERTNCLYLA